MRILQVTPYYYPHLGGIERHVRALSEGLSAGGHDVVVLTMAHEKDLPRQETIGGVTVRRFPAIGPRHYRMPLGLITYLRRQASMFDVVHAHNYHDAALLLTFAVCRHRTVISPHYHGPGRAHSRAADALHMFYDPIASRLLTRASRVICQSPGEADLVSQYLRVPRERLAIIGSGVPTPETLVRQQADDGMRLLLSVGRLESYKHVDRLIAAMSFMGQGHQLAIVGVGPDKGKLERLAHTLGLDGQIQFLGRVDDRELKGLYQRASVLASFSEAESFGITILEGLGAGCRIVCSDIPSFRDFATEFPRAVSLVPASADAREIAETLQAAAYPVDRVQVDLQRYSWPEIIRRVLDVYAAVVATNRSEVVLHYEEGSIQ